MLNKGLYYELVLTQSNNNNNDDDEKDEELAKQLQKEMKTRTRTSSIIQRRQSILSIKSTISDISDKDTDLNEHEIKNGKNWWNYVIFSFTIFVFVFFYSFFNIIYYFYRHLH